MSQKYIKGEVMSGKGSAPRPFEVDRQTFESNWDRIFNNDRTRGTGNHRDVPQVVAVHPSDGGTDEAAGAGTQDTETKRD
jgi:hypothetical protein